jgi:hypothetical protein
MRRILRGRYAAPQDEVFPGPLMLRCFAQQSLEALTTFAEG